MVRKKSDWYRMRLKFMTLDTKVAQDQRLHFCNDFYKIHNFEIIFSFKCNMNI